MENKMNNAQTYINNSKNVVDNIIEDVPLFLEDVEQHENCVGEDSSNKEVDVFIFKDGSKIERVEDSVVVKSETE
jgi:hypothetical protein